MTKLNLQGCGTALVTPFKITDVDFQAFRSLVKRQVRCGVDFLVPLGTTGETPCLNNQERIEILKITKEECGGKPVIVGGGTNSLQDTISAMKVLEPYGPDAFLIVVPYYNKPTQEGQYQYFKAVAAATKKPVIIYNVPGRTGANMLPQTVLRLANDVPNIIAIKEASGNYEQVSTILREAPKGFQVLSGDDDMTLAFMATGASGVISVASNIAPKEVANMTHRILAGDIENARKLHHRLWPLFKACFVESNPVPAKAALKALGLCRNELRLPLVPATKETEKLMAQVIKDLKVDY